MLKIELNCKYIERFCTPKLLTKEGVTEASAGAPTAVSYCFDLTFAETPSRSRGNAFEV
jgi:hypothetical protein